MKTLKKLTFAICLVLALAGAGFADDPPCTNNPGELNTPPCSLNQPSADDTVNQSSPISSEVDTLTIETAISAIESLLTVF